MTIFRLEKSQEKRTLELVNDQEGIIGKMTFPRWNFNRITGVVNDNEYKIEPKSIWKNDFIIIRNQYQVGFVKTDWLHNYKIDLEDIHGEKHFLKMKNTGTFKYSFEVKNVQNHPYLKIKPNYKWKNMAYTYEADFVNELDEGLDKGEMLFVFGFLSAYTLAASAGTT